MRNIRHSQSGVMSLCGQGQSEPEYPSLAQLDWPGILLSETGKQES